MDTRISRRHLMSQAIAGGLALGLQSRAFAASEWPRQPLKLVVPYAPGGVNDVVMRLLGRRVSERLGQPVVVENRPGAGGVVGTNAVVRAEPNGYTIGAAATSTLIATPLTNLESSLDAARDLAFVSIVATVPMVLTVNASIPVNNAAELTRYVRAHRGKLGYGSMAVGHYGHVAVMELSDAENADMVHSPYRGEAPLLQDLVGDQIQLAFITPPAVLPMADSGKIKLLGVSGTKRLRLFPNVPTLAEQGFKAPIFQMNAGWMGIVAPAHTPADALQRLNAEYVAAVRDPEINKQMSDLGLDPVGSTAEAFRATYLRERPVWRKMLVKAGLEVKPE
jgi:tripartite-type tricarboxylate transporter receptor subunit TctC